MMQLSLFAELYTLSLKQMQLQTSATQIDFFPVTTGNIAGSKRFVKRVIWHPGEETEMTTFTTRLRSDAIYDINQYIANGATVTDFNLEPYAGSDYSPLYC
jgi:hypothetical protein